MSRWTDINTIAHNIAVQVESGNWLYSLVGIGMVVAMLFAVWFVSYSDGAERRIPVQYAARKYNARGQASYIPVKLLMSGVMPIIFAGVIMSIPATVDMFIDATKHVRLHTVLSVFSSGNWIYYAVYVILIALFNFFYIEIQFDAVSISSNLRNQGGAVPGYRPGPQTTEMLNKALHKMAQTGSFYLAIIALMPMVLSLISGTQISFGGTSLMIMSSVALEVVRSMEGYLTVRHHKAILGIKGKRQMSIIEFILGLVVLAASLVVSCACYIVKNEKGGLNAALGGASDFMTTRRNDNNLKVNKFVVKVGVVLTIAILALTIIGAHFLRRNAVKKE